ncbi:hypothetical protein VPH35_004026 [Triticum aestivum]|uniref:uncharacterized protein isoform X5 n=1 Tax=Triticum aestivum TaxID=4565 RepID=UPI00084389FD|nr:uncharacterized protein LOC123062755 isoform X5 [Triticum aestivum]
MASRGKLMWKSESSIRGLGAEKGKNADEEVTAKFRKLNLAAGEDEKLIMSDDEEDEDEPKVFSVIGKVLSPSTLQLQTIMGAMKPASGNPKGLRARMVGDNVFIVDFMTEADKERALDGTPWLVGRHAVLLKEFEKNLRPLDVRFESMHIWVRIINILFKWMNKKKGWKVAGLAGKVDKLDVDEFGDAAGKYLRARVEIPIEKPLKRYITIETSEGDEYYDLQYEKLPFFCFSCGIMGHSELECQNPSGRDAEGKWEYDNSIRAPEERRRRIQSFAQAAATSDWSGSSYRSDSHSSSKGKSTEQSNSQTFEKEKCIPGEVSSPSEKMGIGKGGGVQNSNTCMTLFTSQAQDISVT